jgi:transcriptional regulator with XRE-family HTH domain
MLFQVMGAHSTNQLMGNTSTKLVGGARTLVTMASKTEIRTPFGERLHKARKHANLSQEDLAARVDMAQTNLSHLEWRGEGSQKVADLARECGVRVQWLARGIGAMVGPETPVDAAIVASEAVASYAKPSEARDYRTIAHTLAEALEEQGVSISIKQFLALADATFKKVGRL